MTRAALMQLFAQWIGEITEAPAPALDERLDLVQDLGLDSLAIAELAAKLRMRFKIKLRPGEVHQDLRLGHLVDLVLTRLPQ